MRLNTRLRLPSMNGAMLRPGLGGEQRRFPYLPSLATLSGDNCEGGVSSTGGSALVPLLRTTPDSLGETETALQALHSGRSGGLLGHTTEFLCDAKLAPTAEDPGPQTLLVPYLHPLFNAFSSWQFPQSRISPVTPIFKRGDDTD
ncbi:hypothetical protein WJX79_005330 [Trebouxia sp. C0005]